MGEQPILQVNNLSVTLDGERLLRDVSFSVARGEALVIIGPNGAGKTVLFRALLGLAPHEGEIRWREGVKIGYIPQKLPLDKAIPVTVREFFLIKAKRFWFAPRGFLEHLDHELELVGLDASVLAKPIGELSGGQFQRLMVAWAILDHPDVLLFDEPTAGIDVGSEETIYNLINRIQRRHGTTVIMISHDLHIVYRYASRVLCLNKTLLCSGAPREVLNSDQLAALYGESGHYHHGTFHHEGE